MRCNDNLNDTYIWFNEKRKKICEKRLTCGTAEDGSTLHRGGNRLLDDLGHDDDGNVGDLRSAEDWELKLCCRVFGRWAFLRSPPPQTPFIRAPGLRLTLRKRHRLRPR